MKKIISLILLIKSMILIYGSYMGISKEEYFEILNLKLDGRLYYAGLLFGILLLICSLGVYKGNKSLIIITRWIVIIDILYLTFTALYGVYSFIISNIGIKVLFAALIITIIVGFVDVYILRKIKDIIYRQDCC